MTQNKTIADASSTLAGSTILRKHMNIHLESIKAYKNMIKRFEKEIARLEAKVYNERCCWDYKKKRIYLPVIERD